MEQLNLNFNKGIRRTPSMGQDSELSECVNLTPKNGELVNVKHSKKVDDGSSNKLVAVYTTTDSTTTIHYIYYEATSGKLYDGTNELVTITANSQKLKVLPMGNTLVVTDETGITYLVWKNSSYSILQNRPSLEADFEVNKCELSKTFSKCLKVLNQGSGDYGMVLDISRHVKKQQGYYSLWEGTLSPGYYRFIGLHNASSKFGTWICRFSDGTSIEFSLENTDYYDFEVPSEKSLSRITMNYTYTDGMSFDSWRKVSFQVEVKESDLNSDYTFVHSEEYGEKNYTALVGNAALFSNWCQDVKKQFIYPFFIRYAFKLYDGSYVDLSAPMLVVPNWGNIPLITTTLIEEESSDATTATFYANGCSLGLSLKIAESLSKWKDIISNVSIAISSPIYKWNQGKEYNQSVNYVSANKKSVTNLQDLFLINEECERVSLTDTYSDIMSSSDTVRVELPSFSEKEFKDNLLSASTFYVVKNIKIEDILNSISPVDGYYNWEGDVLDAGDSPLTTLTTLPVLPDDFNSQDTFVPETAFIYNNRLSIANIRENIKTATCLVSPVGINTNETWTNKVFVYVKENDQEFVLEYDLPVNNKVYPMWFYYPHNGAYKAIIYLYGERDEETGEIVYNKSELTLTEHPSLNGSYWYEDGNAPQYTLENPTETPTANPSVLRTNYIYTSNVNNPFYFPASLQETIGSGTINAVTTSAKALSQGQFGQFPLYAFCSDGIWALSVASDGKYATTNPVSRDVCNNISSIVQIDSAVVFPTEQGLKLLSESSVENLSLAMEGENVDESEFFEGDSLCVTDTESFVNMLSKCKILYDYANLALHVYPDGCEETGKHYVYSFSSNEWSSVVSDDSKVKAIVPGYPFSTMQLTTGELAHYDNTEDNTNRYNGILLTRTIDMGNPLGMKIINDLRMIYKKMSKDAKCSVAIFASNDGYQWTKVKSLRKHSWKYYRFRIKTQLTNLEALTGMVTLYDLRRNNKLR